MGILFILLTAVLFMAGPSAELWAGEPAYVGVKSCSRCHKKKQQGEQFRIWENSRHAKAYRTLATAKAKEKAGRLGVQGDPRQAEACLVCHATGFGEPPSRLGRKFKLADGVQCESCHGAGANYKKKSVMKKIFRERGKDRKGASATAEKTGLIIPDEQTCKTCHAKQTTRGGRTFKNPSYKQFNFIEDFKKIEHPVRR